MNIAHESKSNKTPLYLIGELIGVPNTVMDSALHELKDRIDKDPKYKDVKNWIGSNLYPRSEPIFFQYQARCDFNVSGFYFNSYCFILNLINS